MKQLFGNSHTNPQAEAVLAYLSGNDGIQPSWSGDRYEADPTVAEWHNGRERGFVVSMRSKNFRRQFNVAFFEHRNSDDICAVAWEQLTANPPTIDSANFGDVYKDKYDVSHTVEYGQAAAMAEWIYKQLTDFWVASSEAAA